MPAITGVEFRQFSAQHHNAQRNWLVVKLNTDDPRLFGLGDASPMVNEEEVKLLIRGVLKSELPAISPAGRRVSLQVRRGGHWYGVARARTRAGGTVVLRMRLRAGQYVMRVEYAGAPELAAAMSRTFVVKVPKRRR